MNKFILSVSILCLSGLSSCSKFLDTKPEEFLSPVTYYQTENQLNIALNGIYDVLGTGSLYKTNYICRMNTEGDEGYYGRSNFNVGPQVYEFESNDATVTNFWRDLYIGIERANVFLANVNNNTAIDEGVRNRLRGEAKFLRAYYYFMLVSHFGGVPLKTTPTTGPTGNNMARASAAEVYDFVVKEMEEAEPLVRTITSAGNSGRVNKSAVRGMLARVNLYWAGFPLRNEARYAEVIKWTKMIMDDTQAGHALNPSYDDVFIKLARDEYDIKESLWEVEFHGLLGGTLDETGLVGSGVGLTVPANSAGIGQAYGYIKATGKLWRAYPLGDLRRDWNIANYTLNSAGVRVPLTLNPSASQQNTRDAAKYRREFERTIPATNNWTPINWPILRYSDVLLMYAEAENAVNGVTQSAIDAVNLVRRRGYGKDSRGEVVLRVVVNSGGAGYSGTYTANFVGGGGTGATATVALSSGRVSSLTMTNYGSGYTSVPTITLTGGANPTTAANLTAVLSTPDNYLLTPTETASSEVFLEAIQTERSRELCFEGLRRMDLIRWGLFEFHMKQALSIITAAAPTAYYRLAFLNASERHTIYPIPSREIALNRALTQNIGW